MVLGSHTVIERTILSLPKGGSQVHAVCIHAMIKVPPTRRYHSWYSTNDGPITTNVRTFFRDPKKNDIDKIQIKTLSRCPLIFKTMEATYLMIQ